MLGYANAEEVLALEPERDVFIDPAEQNRLMKEFNKGVRVDNIELRWKRKDGNVITVRLSGRVVNTPGEPDNVMEIIDA